MSSTFHILPSHAGLIDCICYCPSGSKGRGENQEQELKWSLLPTVKGETEDQVTDCRAGYRGQDV